MASRALTKPPIVLSMTNGRNGYDTPTDLPEGVAAEAMNLLLGRSTLAQKRYGSVAQSFTGDSFSGYNALGRFVPGQNDAAAELFIVDRSGTPKILSVTGGTAAVNLTLVDNCTNRPQDTTFATVNGKMYIAYESAVNRLHVVRPAISTTIVSAVGLTTPGAPTVANNGPNVGYPAILRYYEVSWLVVNGGVIQRESNRGASVSFTPSGSGTAARVTQPTPPGAGENQWIVWGSADGVLFYNISGNIAIGTTTYDDSAAPSTYPTHTAAEPAGTFTPWPSVKFLLGLGNRLMGFGVFGQTTGNTIPTVHGRVYFSPVLFTTDTDDDERVSDTTTFEGWIDLLVNGGGEERALSGPIDNNILAFFSRGIYMLVPTGDAQTPYRSIAMHPTLGAVSQWSTFMGEDESGRPALYFLDPDRGPYRYGANGFQWLGYDVQDVWATFNPAATNRTAHGLWSAERRAAIFQIATGSNNDPDTTLVFRAELGESTRAEGVRNGWAVWSGLGARCSLMFSKTFGSSMSLSLKPYLGGSSTLLRTDDPAATSDNSVAFQGYVTSRGFKPGRPINMMGGDAYVMAQAASGVTLTLSVINNFAAETRTSTASLTAAGSETRVFRKFDAFAFTDGWEEQFKIGDASAVANVWQLDQLMITQEPLEQR